VNAYQAAGYQLSTDTCTAQSSKVSFLFIRSGRIHQHKPFTDLQFIPGLGTFHGSECGS
jgi:hypothetical protein